MYGSRPLTHKNTFVFGMIGFSPLGDRIPTPPVSAVLRTDSIGSFFSSVAAAVGAGAGAILVSKGAAVGGVAAGAIGFGDGGPVVAAFSSPRSLGGRSLTGCGDTCFSAFAISFAAVNALRHCERAILLRSECPRCTFCRIIVACF